MTEDKSDKGEEAIVLRKVETGIGEVAPWLRVLRV